MKKATFRNDRRLLQQGKKPHKVMKPIPMRNIHFQGYRLTYTGVDTGRSNSISSTKVQSWLVAVKETLAKHEDLFESPTLAPYDVELNFCPMGHPAYGYKQPVSLVTVNIVPKIRAYGHRKMGFFAPQEYRDSFWGALQSYTRQAIIMIGFHPIRGWQNFWHFYKRCHLERHNEPLDEFIPRLARMAETMVEKTAQNKPCYLF
jgi:hypothetical protein